MANVKIIETSNKRSLLVSTKLSVRDIVLLGHIAPETLVVRNEEGNNVFQIDISNRPLLSEYGVVFDASNTRDSDAKITEVFDPASPVFDNKGEELYLTVLGSQVKENLTKIENQVKEYYDKVKDLKLEKVK